MEQNRRSRRAELAALRVELTAQGVPLRQLAQLIRSRYHVNSRVAYRLAHGLTQQQVADRWNDLWPSDDGQAAITHKHISYWEAWPAATGRAPSAQTLNRVARIYCTSAADLLDGEDYTEPDHRSLPARREPVSVPALTSAKVEPEPPDVLTRVDRSSPPRTCSSPESPTTTSS